MKLTTQETIKYKETRNNKTTIKYKEKRNYKWKILAIQSITSISVIPGIIFSVHMLVIEDYFKWVEWILPYLVKNKFTFYAFIDFMSYINVIDQNQKLELRELYKKMMKDGTNVFEDELIKEIINIAINPGDKQLKLNYNNKYPNQNIEGNTIFIFYNNLNRFIESKNIKKAGIESADSWIEFIFNLWTSNLKTPLLFYLKIAFPIFGYIKTSSDIIQKYQKINNIIFLKEIINPIVYGEGTKFYIHDFSTIAFDAINKKTDFLTYISTEGSEFLGEDSWKNFFIGQIETVINIQLYSNVNKYFEGVQNSMIEKK